MMAIFPLLRRQVWLVIEGDVDGDECPATSMATSRYRFSHRSTAGASPMEAPGFAALDPTAFSSFPGPADTAVAVHDAAGHLLLRLVMVRMMTLRCFFLTTALQRRILDVLHHTGAVSEIAMEGRLMIVSSPLLLIMPPSASAGPAHCGGGRHRSLIGELLLQRTRMLVHVGKPAMMVF